MPKRRFNEPGRKLRNISHDYYVSELLSKIQSAIKYKNEVSGSRKRIKVNESRCIAFFVVSGSIKKVFSIDCVNIYFSQLIVNYLFLIFFNGFKSVGLPHIAYIVIH